MIDGREHEESSGFQTEHIYGTVVAKKGIDFFKAVGYRQARFVPKAGRNFCITSEEKISEDEYKRVASIGQKQ